MKTDKPLNATVETPEARESAERSQGNLIRSVTFQAAWDRRDPNPHKNYGVHGVQIDFVLRGSAGAVYFPVRTSWMLPEVNEWHRQLAAENPFLLRAVEKPICAPFSIHSPTQREGWQHSGEEICEFLGAPCWAESSSYLAPDAVWEKMLREGSEGFWKAIEEIYRQNLEIQI